MTPKHACCCVLAAIYLISVACGAAEFSLTDPNNPYARLFGIVADEDSPWVKAVHMVREASGSEANHGYFAPGVGPNYRMTFILKDVQGRAWTDAFDKTGYHEADLRLSGIVDVMVNNRDEDDCFQSYAKSCAAKMFARHPRAVLVIVRVEEGDMTSMEQFRKGREPTWSKYDDLTFTRGEFPCDDHDSPAGANDNSNQDDENQ
jgi:hypothetical protein